MTTSGERPATDAHPRSARRLNNLPDERPDVTNTYTLVVSETDDGEGITADVYNDAGTIEESTFVAYEDYGLMPDRRADDPPEHRREVNADVTGFELDVLRDDAGFEFRLLADADDELVTERVDDEEMGLRDA